MTDYDSFDGSHERAYSVALMRLNELIEAGRDEDAEGDAVRDVMDMHWYRMDDRQRKRMRHLSVDLQQISDALDKPDHVGAVDHEWADELQLARKLPGIEGADRILAVLRDQRAGRPSGNFFFIQAKQYERLGMPEVAECFYGTAEKRIPWFNPEFVTSELPMNKNATLRINGDVIERLAVEKHGLDTSFANYQTFWQNHILPATNRPNSIDVKYDAARIISLLGSVSYSLFLNISYAADSLSLVRNGDFGGPRYRNCTEVLKYSGDAVQLFTELQSIVVEIVRIVTGSPGVIWTLADYKNTWEPRRDIIIGYRNYLTHDGHPYVMLRQTEIVGRDVPCVLGHEYYPRKSKKEQEDLSKKRSWEEQESSYSSQPEKWLPLTDVCARLFQDSLSWLNDAYGQLLATLNPFLTEVKYRQLWGQAKPSQFAHMAMGSGQGVSGNTVGHLYINDSGSGISAAPEPSGLKRTPKT